MSINKLTPEELRLFREFKKSKRPSPIVAEPEKEAPPLSNPDQGGLGGQSPINVEPVVAEPVVELGDPDPLSELVIVHEKTGKGMRNRYTITPKGFSYLIKKLYKEKKTVNELTKQFNIGISCIRSFKNRVDKYIDNVLVDQVKYSDIFRKL